MVSLSLERGQKNPINWTQSWGPALTLFEHNCGLDDCQEFPPNLTHAFIPWCDSDSSQSWQPYPGQTVRVVIDNSVQVRSMYFSWHSKTKHLKWKKNTPKYETEIVLLFTTYLEKKVYYCCLVIILHQPQTSGIPTDHMIFTLYSSAPHVHADP